MLTLHLLFLIRVHLQSGTSVTFYVDGIPDGSGKSTRNPSSTISGSAIGAGIINGSLQGYSIETIDEVRIWNIARTQSEIMNNKDCELNAQTGLAALYHFNHGIPNGSNPSTTVLTDYSGNSRNGVLGGFALNGTTSNWVNSIVFQPTNIYRTITSGNWSDPAIWETQYGSCWVPAVTAPTSTDSSISIRNGHTVTVNSVVTIDQTQVDAGGSLIVSSGTLQVMNHPSTDLFVMGTMTFSGSFIEGDGEIEINTGATLTWTNGNMRGTGTTTIKPGGTFVLGGVGTKIINDGRTINNYGTCNLTSSVTGSLAFGASVQFNNYGTFNINSGADFAVVGGVVAPAFNNMVGGIVNKNDVDTTSLTSPNRLNNYGTFNVNAGIFTLNSSVGVHSGIYNVTSQGRLNGTGNMNFTGSTFTNNGEVSMSAISFSGTALQTIAGNGSFSNVTFNNASGFTLTDSPLLKTSVSWTNGILTCAGRVILSDGITQTSTANCWVNGIIEYIIGSGLISRVATFEIGDATSKAKMQLSFPAISGPGSIIARTVAGDGRN